MLRAAIALSLLFAAAPAAAQREGVSATAAPAPGTAQRRAILDALRPAVEARLGPNVEFVVSDIRVRGGWAFVMAEPQRRGGGRIDGRAYFRHFDHMDGLTVTAVLRFRQAGWSLVRHAIGATDVWWCDLGRQVPGCESFGG